MKKENGPKEWKSLRKSKAFGPLNLASPTGFEQKPCGPVVTKTIWIYSNTKPRDDRLRVKRVG